MLEAKVFQTIIKLPATYQHNYHGAHKEIWKAFPGRPAGTAQPFTFRQLLVSTEETSNHSVPYLVQSSEKPDWSMVRGVSDFKIQEHIYELTEGLYYQYCAVLAPIVKLADRSRKNSRQVSLSSDERVWEWFEARATNIGLMVDPFRARFEKARVYPKGRSNKHIFFTQVRFEGIASIADPEKVKLALETGMAGKKAFGFGMLNLLSMGE